MSTSEYSWWDPGININHDLSLILRDLKGIDLVSCITALRRIINIKGEPWIKS